MPWSPQADYRAKKLGARCVSFLRQVYQPSHTVIQRVTQHIPRATTISDAAIVTSEAQPTPHNTTTGISLWLQLVQVVTDRHCRLKGMVCCDHLAKFLFPNLSIITLSKREGNSSPNCTTTQHSHTHQWRTSISMEVCIDVLWRHVFL